MARVLPRQVVAPARQQQLRLDAQEPRGHLEVLRRLVEAEGVHRVEELVGDARDRDVPDVDLLAADQVQQEVERAGVPVERDDERAVGGPGAHGPGGGHRATVGSA